MADLQESKPSLRRRILGMRDAIDPWTRTALSRAIVRDITKTSVYRRSNTVMAYASFGSELQTDEFMRHVLHQGKMLLLPRVNRQKGSLDVYRVGDPIRDLQTAHRQRIQDTQPSHVPFRSAVTEPDPHRK
jgi:5,10-methenyltetrahydrofolate synthetase